MITDTGNPDPGLGQAHKCGRVKMIYINILIVSMLHQWYSVSFFLFFFTRELQYIAVLRCQTQL